MSLSFVVADIASELALFAAAGFLLFALDDLAVDIVYLVRRAWRATTVYTRYPRAFAGTLARPARPGRMAVFIPAWDEGAVIGAMLRATLERWGAADYLLYVGFYPNDPATAAALGKMHDPRVRPVQLPHAGPTTKADCLNHLYAALAADEAREGWSAKAVVLHDSEDLVHPLEIALFDTLVERAALVQLPVLPLQSRGSRWVSGHYCDEFAESHGKEMVVREAIGASIPLAGVGCAIERKALTRLAERRGGQPFAADCLTEDYELGLRLGEINEGAMFVRIPAHPGSRALVASRGHFPETLDAAVRQKARWIGGIALAGWDRLGWRGGLGERWMRMRDRRGPLAALLLVAGYGAALLWLQMALAHALGAPVVMQVSPLLAFLLKLNLALLAWRLFVRLCFVTAAYGIGEGLRSLPRTVVGNVIAILAVRRAIAHHVSGRAAQWEKTAHIFPAAEPAQ
ncbi:glycosyl transferase family protein [Sphingomonas mesophila]|uniref:glycosyl transferase family protein n=1 Tax=Sphingomonas mesophila TaxID=2303576 RepID=UPI001F086E59|nr:glycosyl transferase family protein [Sphingomonas mesophila]